MKVLENTANSAVFAGVQENAHIFKRGKMILDKILCANFLSTTSQFASYPILSNAAFTLSGGNGISPHVNTSICLH